MIVPPRGTLFDVDGSTRPDLVLTCILARPSASLRQPETAILWFQRILPGVFWCRKYLEFCNTCSDRGNGLTRAADALATDHRRRAQRWHDAVATLTALQTEYAIWLESLPVNL